MLSTIAEIIRDLLVFVAVITALLIALVVVVSKMPDTNPLKRVLTALSYRLGATLAAGALAIPVEPIPGIDVLYDIGVPILLIWYWLTFFKNAFDTKTDSSQSDQKASSCSITRRTKQSLRLRDPGLPSDGNSEKAFRRMKLDVGEFFFRQAGVTFADKVFARFKLGNFNIRILPWLIQQPSIMKPRLDLQIR